MKRNEISEYCEKHEVSYRMRNCLLRAGITTLEAFAALSEDELYKIHGVGKKTVETYKVLQELYLNGE